MPQPHIVRSYEEELERLKDKVLELAEECEDQLQRALSALQERNEVLARDIIRSDERIDALQRAVDDFTVRLLAMRQPVAVDLRNIVAALKMAADLERIADYAANIARHVSDLDPGDTLPPISTVIRMIETAQGMLSDVLQAYRRLDLEKAVAVWHADEELDRMYTRLLEEVRLVLEKDDARFRAATGLIFLGRCCERIGDHVKNLAETVHFIVTGAAYAGHPAE